MQLCWHADAATRPTFPQIRVSLVDAGRTEDAKLLWLRADLTEQSMDRVEKLLAEAVAEAVAEKDAENARQAAEIARRRCNWLRAANPTAVLASRRLASRCTLAGESQPRWQADQTKLNAL